MVFVFVILLAVLPLTSLAGDAMHLEELNFYNSSKDIFRGSPSDWNKTDTRTYGVSPSEWYSTWQDNPALVELQGDFVFISSMFYSGSYSDFSADMYKVNALAVGLRTSDISEEYIGNSTGTDLGFLMALSDSATLGGLLHYRYDGMLGEGDSLIYRLRPLLPDAIFSYVDSEHRSDAHSTGLTLLYDLNFSDTFSLGLDLTYLFTSESTNNTVNMKEITFDGSGVIIRRESERTARETVFTTHRLSPTVGASFTPSNTFSLNLAVTTDIIFGEVEKNMDAADRTNGLPTNPLDYRERLDGGGLSGYGITAEADAEIFLTDALSLSLLLCGSYLETSWDIDGDVSGWFDPDNYKSCLHLAPGTNEYEYEEHTWHTTFGVGMNYALSKVALHSLLTYTRWERDTAYYMENLFTTPISGVPHSIFTQRTGEELDILTLKLGTTLDVSSAISMDFGLGYSVGWGDYDYYEYIHSWDSSFQDGLFILLNETDTFHELSAAVSMIITPMENLNITLSAMGAFPLDGKSYPLDGSMINGNPASGLQGDFSLDSEISTWNYGGNLSIEYRF